MKWKELTKIGISGSRSYPGLSWCGIWLEKYITKNFESSENVVVIHGGALGVDSMIESTCFRRGIKCLTIPARWVELEKVAGPRRNQHIVDLCNEFYAFWDGKSPGTKSAINMAKKAGKLIKVYSPEDLRKEVGAAKIVSMSVSSKTKKAGIKRLKKTMQEAKDYFADLD